jgi:hypothetical protein
MEFIPSSSSNPPMDCSNPLYLHHGDSPGSVLVSQLLNGDNYNTWSRSMIMALTAKNKVHFIDGSMPKPDPSSADFLPWTRCNNMVLSWIINSVSKEIAGSIIYIDTSEAMWRDIKDRFSQQNGPRIFQIQKAISALSQDNLSVSSYFTSLKGLWDELLNYRPLPACSCGAMKTLVEYQHQEYVFQFLMGLNDSFSYVRGQILLLDPLPPINKVFSLVTQEERQREISSSLGSVHHDAAALMTKTAPSPGSYRTSGSNVPRYGKQGSFRKDRPTCTHCGVYGHTMEKCYKLHGFPPGFKFTRGKAVDNHSANQVSEQEAAYQMPITQEQCQKLLALIKPSSETISSANQVSNAQDHLVANMSGKILLPLATLFFLLFPHFKKHLPFLIIPGYWTQEQLTT